MVSEHEGRTGLSAWWAVREVDHLFGAIGRYTRFVAFSKIGLLAVAGVLTASLIAWPLFTKDKSGIRISFIDSKTAAGKTKPASPVMDNPEFHGIGTQGQQYKVTGKTATQQSPTLVLIAEPEAQMVKADGSWYSLTAERAEYQQEKKLIDLFNDVTVIDGKASTFTTSHATITMPAMDVVGNEPISGTGSFGNILASGFEIKDKGAHMIFIGGTKQLKVTVDKAKKK